MTTAIVASAVIRQEVPRVARYLEASGPRTARDIARVCWPGRDQIAAERIARSIVHANPELFVRSRLRGEDRWAVTEAGRRAAD